MATYLVLSGGMHSLLSIIAVIIFFYALLIEGLQKHNWGVMIFLFVVAALIGPAGISIFG